MLVDTTVDLYKCLFLGIENTVTETLINIISNLQSRHLDSFPLEIFIFSTLSKSLTGKKGLWK